MTKRTLSLVFLAIILLVFLSCLSSAASSKSLFKFSPGGVTATTDIPLFEFLSWQETEFDGGSNFTFTFRNYGSSATNGSVWIPWEKVLCTVPLVNTSAGLPSGNLSEAELSFDINGDGDAKDVFEVHYVDNATVEIDGVMAHAQLPPGRRIVYDSEGIYYIYDKNSFQLGSKNHTLYRVSFSPQSNSGYADFGLDSFFQYYPSPCIQFIIDQTGESMYSNSKAEIVSMKLNGTMIPFEFNTTEVLPGGPDGQWFVDKVYVYPLGSLDQNASSTIELSIRGEPGSYLLFTIFNWSPDAVNRYKYSSVGILPIKGTVRRNIVFGDQVYPIDIFTNSTTSQSIVYNWITKKMNFNTTCLSGFTFFWNVTIPQDLLKGNPWTLNIAGSPTSFIQTSNGTHSSLYFNLNASMPLSEFFTDLVSIEGTWALNDTFSPRVSIPLRDPSGIVAPLQPVKVSVNATDIESGVMNATLYYTTDNGTSWSTQPMAYNFTTTLYEATIPGQQAGTLVNFKIVVYDTAGNDATLELGYNVEAAVWAPSPEGTLAAGAITVGVTTAVSLVAASVSAAGATSATSAAGTSASHPGSTLMKKIEELFPETWKKWLADFVSSRHKLSIEQKVGSPFLPTRQEMFSFMVSLSVLTFYFSYAKADDLSQILPLIPTILATSIFVDFVKSFALEVFMRRRGVWTEHRLWYYGLAMFLVTTLAFKAPFSSPSRNVHHASKFTKRLEGLASFASVVVALAFAAAFYVLFVSGFTLIGNVGLVMCLMGAFFDSIPIPLMNGRSIYYWNKVLWILLMITTSSIYIVFVLMA